MIPRTTIFITIAILVLLIMLLLFTNLGSVVAQWLGGRAAAPHHPVGTKFLVQTSGYAPSPYQTDSTPCITGAGTRVRPGVVATPRSFLPLGTLFVINDETFADRVFIVEDSMAIRYEGQQRVDIWFPATTDALEHGRRSLEIEIIGYGVPGQKIARVVPGGGEELTQGSDEERPQVEIPGVLEQARLRVVAINEVIADFLGANANRFDVNCNEIEPAS